jgi:nucleotide-binding universal stress UspA family protein
METYFKLLVATDYSEEVRNAERYALQFATRTQASVTLLHVADPPPEMRLLVREQYPDMTWQNELEELRMHALQLTSSLQLPERDLTYDCVVREGQVGEEVCEEAEKQGANFIITGMHGPGGGLRDIFPGSHTWEVISHATCPVLVIPPDGYFTGIKQITYVTEYRPGEMSAIAFLARLAECFGAGLLILHLGNRSLPKEMERQLFAEFRESVYEKLNSRKADIRLLQGENPVAAINQFCFQSETDWLALSPGKSTLLSLLFGQGGNLTRQMSFYSRIPMLAIPDNFSAMDNRLWKALEQVGEEKQIGGQARAGFGSFY